MEKMTTLNAECKTQVEEMVQFIFTEMRKKDGFPDIGLDADVLKLLSPDSISNLGDELAHLRKNLKPDDLRLVINKSITSIGGLSVVNSGAVGIPALAMHMLLNSVMKSYNVGGLSMLSQLKRIFPYEKSSEIAAVIERYFKKLYVVTKDPEALRQETEKHEADLGFQLTRMKRIIVQNGGMCSSAVKSWVNGAAMHVYLLILLARLGDKRKGKALNAAKMYTEEMESILEQYKDFKKSKLDTADVGPVILYSEEHGLVKGSFYDREMRKCIPLPERRAVKECGTEIIENYVDLLMQECDAVKRMRHFFETTIDSIDWLVEQKGDLNVSSLTVE